MLLWKGKSRRHWRSAFAGELWRYSQCCRGEQSEHAALMLLRRRRLQFPRLFIPFLCSSLLFQQVRWLSISLKGNANSAFAGLATKLSHRKSSCCRAGWRLVSLVPLFLLDSCRRLLPGRYYPPTALCVGQVIPTGSSSSSVYKRCHFCAVT